MARQAEAERNRRAKVINAEGEYQAAGRLAEAAEVIRPNPVTIQLRYLQSLSDISANQGSTIVFPLPIDLIRPLLESGDKSAGPEAQERPAELEDAEAPAGITAGDEGVRRQVGASAGRRESGHNGPA
jgi:hypothetical protein